MPTKKRMIKIIPERLKWIMLHPPKDKVEAPDKPRITREELEDMAGISVKTIQNARTTGSISRESLESICKSLNVSTNYLLGIDDTSLRDRELFKEKFKKEINESERILKQKPFLNTTYIDKPFQEIDDSTSTNSENNVHEYNRMLRELNNKLNNKVQEESKILENSLRYSKALYTLSNEKDNDYKRLNRIDNDNIFIPYYDRSQLMTFNYTDIQSFIQSFMHSHYYVATNIFDNPDINDFYWINNSYERLQPYMNEYIDTAFIHDLSKSINDFIRMKMKENQDNEEDNKEED